MSNDLLDALKAYLAAEAMPTHGDASDFVFPEIRVRVKGSPDLGKICDKHGLVYGYCHCCQDDLMKHRHNKDREARNARDDALRAAREIARAAIAKAEGGQDE